MLAAPNPACLALSCTSRTARRTSVRARWLNCSVRSCTSSAVDFSPTGLCAPTSDIELICAPFSIRATPASTAKPPVRGWRHARTARGPPPTGERATRRTGPWFVTAARVPIRCCTQPVETPAEQTLSRDRGRPEVGGVPRCLLGEELHGGPFRPLAVAVRRTRQNQRGPAREGLVDAPRSAPWRRGRTTCARRSARCSRPASRCCCGGGRGWCRSSTTPTPPCSATSTRRRSASPARSAGPEVWDQLGPLAEAVMGGGRATYSEKQLLLLRRHGYLEETYWTFSYSPVRGADGGSPASSWRRPT